MLKTPEEARGMWCPFARTDFEGVAINRTALGYADDGDIEAGFGIWRCIADQCMAWRWGEKVLVHKGEDKTPTEERRGFCDFAGRP